MTLLLFLVLSNHYFFASKGVTTIPLPSAAEAEVLRARLFAAPGLTAAPEPIIAHAGATSAWRARLAALRTLGVPSYWNPDNTAHVAIIEALMARAIDNTVIIMYGSGGLVGLMANAVCHWARLGMRNYVLFVSNGALAALRAHPSLHGPPDAAVINVAEVFGAILVNVDLDSYANFDTNAFRLQARIKFLLAELMVQLGLHVIIQDTDVVPLLDYRPAILTLACHAVKEAQQRHAALSCLEQCLCTIFTQITAPPFHFNT